MTGGLLRVFGNSLSRDDLGELKAMLNCSAIARRLPLALARGGLCNLLEPNIAHMAAQWCAQKNMVFHAVIKGPLTSLQSKGIERLPNWTVISIPPELSLRRSLPQALEKAVALQNWRQEEKGDALEDALATLNHDLRATPFASLWQNLGFPLSRLSNELVFSNLSRYLNPTANMALKPSDACYLLEAQRKNSVDHLGQFVCGGVKFWNRPTVSAVFRSAKKIRFVESAEKAAQTAKGKQKLLLWASDQAALQMQYASLDQNALRIEDGFVRSVGLGAGLVGGASLAVDDLGIYYNARRPSRLEYELETRTLSSHERARGKRLVELLKKSGVTKYNLEATQSKAPTDLAPDTILVPGQVPQDQGVRHSLSDRIECLSCDDINLELLKCVRADNPDAPILFRTHPDVSSGLRKGALSPRHLAEMNVAVDDRTPLLKLFNSVGQLATFSSLSGFEALIQGLSVTTYGMPFYAGWGLTHDKTANPKRTQSRSLEELVYIAFVHYLRCVDPESLHTTTPELLIEKLSQLKARKSVHRKAAVLQRLSWAGRKLGL